MHSEEYCKRACDRTPDSVLCRHLSLCNCRGRAWFARCYLASPLRRRCERARWYERLAAPTDKPAPRTLLLISQRSRLAADIAADAGALLPHPFTPYRPGNARANVLASIPDRRDCSLLPSCVTCSLRHPCPRLWFRRVTCHHSIYDGRGVGKFLWS